MPSNTKAYLVMFDSQQYLVLADNFAEAVGKFKEDWWAMDKSEPEEPESVSLIDVARVIQ